MPVGSREAANPASGRAGDAGPGEQSPGDMAGRVAIRIVRREDGSLAAPLLSSSGLLSARLTSFGIWIVGAGAHPIGGDALSIDVSVGPGASGDVRTAGATVARPGARQAVSRSSIVADVENGGTLRWLVEPGLAVAGAVHLAETTVRLSESARLVWRDEVVVGRFGEPPGTWSTGIRVERTGRALAASRLGVGPAEPAWTSSAVLNRRRAVTSLIVVVPEGCASTGGPAWLTDPTAEGLLSHVDGSPVAQITAWGATLEASRAVVAGLLRRLELPAWVGDIW